jgi:hypothetical protein
MLRVFAALLLALPLASACCAAPTAEDWRAVSYRSPETTFRTFQTALGAGQPDLEYRSLSSDLKRREGLSELAYLEFRDALFRAQPWLARAACAEILSVSELAPDRVRLRAQARFLFSRRSFEVELVREDFYELWRGAELASDGSARFSELVTADPSGVVGRTPAPEAVALGEITELRIGREWKIDAFLELTEP